MKPDAIQQMKNGFDALSQSISGENVQNNVSVRDMLGQRGIRPEKLPPEEDIRKLERRVRGEEKKIEKQSGKLPEPKEER
ncbi:MAG: hypothetical protein JMJ93_07725 [Synergistaceae bacterium]|nr:hypothetical protein [Synergistaceae bacterium]